MQGAVDDIHCVEIANSAHVIYCYATLFGMPRYNRRSVVIRDLICRRMAVPVNTTLTVTEIRARYLDFFASKGHLKVPSSSLVPRNDPTVMLTTAGMQQMIPYFLGRETPPAQRLTSAQKCFRTTDIDKVGKPALAHVL